MRLLQNKIAESTLTLPVVVVVGAVVWLMSGLMARQGWWWQAGCFVASCYLMVELSNGNALLRVRSRMVTATFIALSCAAAPLFSSLRGAVVQLCFIIALLLFFQTYQQPHSVGRQYYGYLFVGIASLVFPQVLYFVPPLWLLTATQLQAFSGRGLAASLLALATPYWIASLWCLYERNFQPLADHFAQMVSFDVPYHGVAPRVGLLALFGFIIILSIAGIVHFWMRSFEDKIRIRLLYGFFTSLLLLTTLFILVQPRHFEVLMRLLTVFASPLIAHFLTLTHSRLTNIVFIVATVLTLALTVLNLWMPSLSF